MTLFENFHRLFFLKVCQTAKLLKSSVLSFMFNSARKDTDKYKRKWEKIQKALSLLFSDLSNISMVKTKFLSSYTSDLNIFYYLILYPFPYLYLAIFGNILTDLITCHKSRTNALISSPLILTAVWNPKCTVWTDTKIQTLSSYTSHLMIQP